MRYIDNFAMNTIAMVLFFFSHGCGNTPSESTTPRIATPERTAAVHETAAATSATEAPVLENAAATAEPARPPAQPAPASAGPSVRRLAVATAISDREPVGVGTTFASDNERLFAFIEASNVGGEPTDLVVTFRSDEGEEVGFANVTIPADVSRWRTWAWSRHVHAPGTWTAVIRTADGVELARQRFEVES